MVYKHYIMLIIMFFVSPAQHTSSQSLLDSENAAAMPFIDNVYNIRHVRVTAYNPCPKQTNDEPRIAAWGDDVFEGMIAVSRDLEPLGLTRNTPVHILGIGDFVVMDRMHRRKTNQIDIFMESYQEAINFGVQYHTIMWPKDF